MSSSSGSEDAEYRLRPPHRILKEITLKVLIIGDYGVGKCESIFFNYTVYVEFKKIVYGITNINRIFFKRKNRNCQTLCRR